MKKAILIGGGIFAALAFMGVTAVVVLLLLAGGGDRYDVTHRGNVTLRTDRFSGKTEMLARDGAGNVVWRPIVEETAQKKVASEQEAQAYAQSILEADKRRAEAERAACDEARRKYEKYREEYRASYGFYPPPTMPNPYSHCE